MVAEGSLPALLPCHIYVRASETSPALTVDDVPQTAFKSRRLKGRKPGWSLHRDPPSLKEEDVVEPSPSSPVLGENGTEEQENVRYKRVGRGSESIYSSIQSRRNLMENYLTEVPEGLRVEWIRSTGTVNESRTQVLENGTLLIRQVGVRLMITVINEISNNR